VHGEFGVRQLELLDPDGWVCCLLEAPDEEAVRTITPHSTSPCDEVHRVAGLHRG
jgi:hypothetical protein